MRFSLHFHEFLIILSTNIFFQNIHRYIQYISNISDISVKSKYRYIRDYRYFHPCLVSMPKVAMSGAWGAKVKDFTSNRIWFWVWWDSNIIFQVCIRPFNNSIIWGYSSSSLCFWILFKIDSALLIATKILAYKSFTVALVLST